MMPVIRASSPAHNAGPLLRELMTAEADAWQQIPPMEPDAWTLGAVEQERHTGSLGQSWHDEPDDFWLQQAHVVELSDASAALLYRAVATVDGATQLFIATAVYRRIERSWQPVLRHISPAGLGDDTR